LKKKKKIRQKKMGRHGALFPCFGYGAARRKRTRRTIGRGGLVGSCARHVII